MTSSGGVFSQTLQEITTTKLKELAKKRKSFETEKAASVKLASEQNDPINKLIAIADGCKACFSISMHEGKISRGSSSNPQLEVDLQNLYRFLDQARFDPSISSKIVQQWEDRLMHYLNVQSLKYQYADLYGQLTMEWLTASLSKVKHDVADESQLVEQFEEVPVRAKIEARRKWESTAFEKADVDEHAIQKFLQNLFGDKSVQKAVKDIRQAVSETERDFSLPNQFNVTSLRWIIKSLLASKLLTNEKRQVLKDFQSNHTILTELADVLNMRITAVGSWSWGSEVPVELKRQLSGKYNMHTHEDVLQTIFLQYIGIKWSVKLKAALRRFQENEEVWHSGLETPSPTQQQRWTWYMQSRPSGSYSVHKIRSSTYRYGFFVSQLLENHEQDDGEEEGEEEAEIMLRVAAPARDRLMRGAPVQDLMEVEESDEDMGFGLFDDYNPVLPTENFRPKNSMDAKQRLLQMLATEVLVKTKLDGEITCFRSHFDELEASLPHETITTMLAFFGFSEKWQGFFRNFLQMPLRFSDEDHEPRLRKRGTPSRHKISDVFSELTLFVLDFAINSQTEGQILWRLHDDLWFWSSSHIKCVKAWAIIQEFSTLTGLQLDSVKSAAVRLSQQENKFVSTKMDASLPSGQIRWGMIYLDPSLGKFTIDRTMVDRHIEELRRQLKDKEASIFSWVQAYSTYASVFFTTNFGKPANCYGREHLDMMLSMHERIQRELFNTDANSNAASVVDWLKSQIEQRFGVKNVPDGYLYFPTQLGGLEVKSPFIDLLQIRDSITEDPRALLDQFLNAEWETYEKSKKSYLERKPWQWAKDKKEYQPKNPQDFMPFDEFKSYRESFNYNFELQLANIYDTMLKLPNERALENDGYAGYHEALNRISTVDGQSKPTITRWGDMSPYWKWVTMLYGPEMMETFDGFEIVDTGLLPMGMVNLFREGRISWQE